MKMKVTITKWLKMAASVLLRAGGLIVFRKIQGDFQYLLLQTSYGHHHWSPPKGMDPNFTQFQTS